MTAPLEEQISALKSETKSLSVRVLKAEALGVLLEWENDTLRHTMSSWSQRNQRRGDHDAAMEENVRDLHVALRRAESAERVLADLTGGQLGWWEDPPRRPLPGEALERMRDVSVLMERGVHLSEDEVRTLERTEETLLQFDVTVFVVRPTCLASRCTSY